MVILVTGATGFLGRNLVPLLLARGHTVYVLVRRSCGFTAPNLFEIIGDLLGQLPESIPWGKLDAVVHLAASGVKASNRDWADAAEVNIAGTMRLLRSLRRHAVRRPNLVITRTFYERLIESHPTLRDNSYVLTKAIASELVVEWSREHNWPCVLATVFQLFGPGDHPSSVLSYAARQMSAGEVAEFGSGDGCRDWLFGNDAAEAVVACVESEGTGLRQYDIGSGRLIRIREVIERMADLVGFDRAKLIFDAKRDRPDTEFAMAAKVFPPGWGSQRSIDAGLRQLLAKAKIEMNV